MNKRCMIFGGTSEGRELAQCAVTAGRETHVYVATPTGAQYAQNRSVRIHVGRLRAEEMAEEIRRIDPDFVLDATHPYATEVTENIRKACEKTDRRYYRVLREAAKEKGDLEAKDAAEAAGLLLKKYPDVPVLLTTGSKELPDFAGYTKKNPKVYVRILPGEDNVARALSAGIGREHIIEGCGPYTEEENLRVLESFGIRVLVTKESGSRGGYAEKLRAAGQAGCAVIVIRRPGEETGITLPEAKRLLSDADRIPEA